LVETASGKVQIDGRLEDNPGEFHLISFEFERVGAAIRLTAWTDCPMSITAWADCPMSTVVELDDWQAHWLSEWLGAPQLGKRDAAPSSSS
jgi:hypothetical protein